MQHQTCDIEVCFPHSASKRQKPENPRLIRTKPGTPTWDFAVSLWSTEAADACRKDLLGTSFPGRALESGRVGSRSGASPVTDLGRFCGGKRAGGFEAECRSGFTGFAVSLGSGAFGLGKRLKTKPSSLAMLCPAKTTPSELFSTAVLCTPMIFGPRSKRSDNHAISRMVVVLRRGFDQACQLQYMKPHAIIQFKTPRRMHPSGPRETQGPWTRVARVARKAFRRTTT